MNLFQPFHVQIIDFIGNRLRIAFHQPGDFIDRFFRLIPARHISERLFLEKIFAFFSCKRQNPAAHVPMTGLPVEPEFILLQIAGCSIKNQNPETVSALRCGDPAAPLGSFLRDRAIGDIPPDIEKYLFILRGKSKHMERNPGFDIPVFIVV